VARCSEAFIWRLLWRDLHHWQWVRLARGCRKSLHYRLRSTSLCGASHQLCAGFQCNWHSHGACTGVVCVLQKYRRQYTVAQECPVGIFGHRHLRFLPCSCLLCFAYSRSHRCRHGTSSPRHTQRSSRQAFLEAIYVIPCGLRTILLHWCLGRHSRVFYQLYHRDPKQHFLRPWSEVPGGSSKLLRGRAIHWFVPDEVHKSAICLSRIYYLCLDLQFSLHHAAAEHWVGDVDVNALLRVGLFPNYCRPGYPWAWKTYKERSWLDRRRCLWWSVSIPSEEVAGSALTWS
jgi:hypothetical protein